MDLSTSQADCAHGHAANETDRTWDPEARDFRDASSSDGRPSQRQLYRLRRGIAVCFLHIKIT